VADWRFRWTGGQRDWIRSAVAGCGGFLSSNAAKNLSVLAAKPRATTRGEAGKNDSPHMKAISPARYCTKLDLSYRQLLSSLVSVTASVFFFVDIKVCCGHAVM
jgi:hypothetical protein